jgi:hypothetical protein
MALEHRLRYEVIDRLESRGPLACASLTPMAPAMQVPRLPVWCLDASWADAGCHTARPDPVAAPLESGLLKIPALPCWPSCGHASIGESGHARFEAAAGVHDDLVLAVALALWRLQSQTKKAAA